ncbi:MAG: hypothetical protein M3373_04245 [Gemmatimonadota bacterium]|nr:hypothetical protein [Gemmatimonadota bacterium]
MTYPPRFPFPALAALAGRVPLSRGREVAVACLMGARLAAGTLPPLSLSDRVRVERAKAARVWLAGLTMPAKLRGTLARLYDASARATAPEMAVAVRAAAEAAATHLDAAARAELEQLAATVAEHTFFVRSR